jgi:hypothetical protein
MPPKPGYEIATRLVCARVAMVGEGARRALNFWRRTTVSLLMLLLVFKRTDTHRLLSIWSTINLRLIAAATLLLMLTPLTSALRW